MANNRPIKQPSRSAKTAISTQLIQEIRLWYDPCCSSEKEAIKEFFRFVGCMVYEQVIAPNSSFDKIFEHNNAGVQIILRSEKTAASDGKALNTVWFMKRVPLDPYLYLSCNAAVHRFRIVRRDNAFKARKFKYGKSYEKKLIDDIIKVLWWAQSFHRNELLEISNIYHKNDLLFYLQSKRAFRIMRMGETMTLKKETCYLQDETFVKQMLRAFRNVSSKIQNETCIYTIYASINAERKIREILQLMNPNEQKGLIHAVSSKSLLKDLQKIERLSPSYCARYFLAAFICLSDQNLELSALQYYNKALEIAGQLSGERSDFYAFVYYQLGAFYEKVLGRESGAALFYENAVLKNANCYQATFKNGCYLAQCGKLQEAAESFQKTMTILSKGLKIRELGSPKNAQCLSLKEWQYIYKTNIWLAKIEWNTKGPEHTWYYLTHAKVAEQMYEQNACLTQLLDDKPAAAGGLTRESFLQYHQNSMPVYLLRGTLQRWEEITGMSRYLE